MNYKAYERTQLEAGRPLTDLEQQLLECFCQASAEQQRAIIVAAALSAATNRKAAQA